MATSTRTPAPASEAQLTFLRKLDAEFQAAQVEVYELAGEQDKADAIRDYDLDAIRAGISKRSASAAIDLMKNEKLPQVRDALRTLRRTAQGTAPAADVEKLEDAIYLFEGEIYKVIVAVHGSGRQYAKRLDPNDRTEKGNARFVYAPGVVKKLRPEHKMTKEQALKYGELYGVCVRCGATLTREESIERAMGPVCAGRFA